MTIGELIVELGFKSDTKTLQSFIHDLGELNLKAVFAATGLGALYKAVKEIMEAADHTATALNNMQGITGVAAKEFEKWDNVAQQFGVSAGATSSSIAGIQSSIFELIKTGSGPGQMIGMLLGIDPRGFAGHPEELLKKELEYLKQFDNPATRRFYAQMLGINDEMLLLVDHTDEINKALANQAKEFETIAQWHQIVNKLAGDFRVLMVTLGAILGPLLQPFVDILTFILNGFEKIIQVIPGVVQGILVIGTVIASVMGMINPIFGAIAAISGIGALAHGLGDKLGLNDIATQGTGGSQFDNSRDIDVNNTYHINGGNTQDVHKAINDHWKKVTHESDLMGYQTNY